MLVKDEVTFGISTLLKHSTKKVLLVTVDDEPSGLEIITHKLQAHASSYILINLEKIQEIVQTSSNASEILLLVGLAANHKLESCSNKIIIVCNKSLLHLTLNAHLYFSPIKANRVQKHLFSKIALPGPPTPASPLIQMQSWSINAREKPTAESLGLRVHFLNQKTNDKRSANDANVGTAGKTR